MHCASSVKWHGERRKSFKNRQTLVRCRTAFKTQERRILLHFRKKTKVSAEFRDKIHIWWLPCGTLLAWSKSGTVPDDPGRLAPMHLCTAGSHMQYYDSLMCIKHSQYAAYTKVQDRRQHNTNKAREECLGQFFKKCSLGDEYFSDGVFPRH